MSRIEKKNIDRRQFLRGAGIGLVGAAGAGALSSWWGMAMLACALAASWPKAA